MCSVGLQESSSSHKESVRRLVDEFGVPNGVQVEWAMLCMASVTNMTTSAMQDSVPV